MGGLSKEASLAEREATRMDVTRTGGRRDAKICAEIVEEDAVQAAR